MNSSDRPNFIIFMTDQQRADHLGCYGNNTVKTPHIDSLAASGTRFINYFVANPICQPNRAALATGQMTSVNGCRQNGIPISLDSTTYADVLRSAGYRTGLVGKAHFQNVSNIPAKPRQQQGIGEELLSPHDRASRSQRSGNGYDSEVKGEWADKPQRIIELPYYGFDYVRLCVGHGDHVEGHYTKWLLERLNGAPDPRGRQNELDDYRPDAPQIWRTAVPEELYPTTFVGEKACHFIASSEQQPFLLLVSYPDPHHPFTPPGKYFDMYDPASVELPGSFSYPTGARSDLPEFMLRAYEMGDKNPDAYWPFHVNEETVQRMIALNYGAISMIDDSVGQILEALAVSGKSGNTVVCYMSDHGDYLGEHGTVLKHGVHSRGLIRVPFIWNDPQRKMDETARNVSTTHGSAIDFAPMLLQRAGLKTPIGMQGRDLLALDVQDLPVLIEDPGIGVYTDPDANTSVRSIVYQNWRLSVFEGSTLGELYDLENDPDELNNLWNDTSSERKKNEMLEMMLQRIIALRDKSVLATNQA